MLPFGCNTSQPIPNILADTFFSKNGQVKFWPDNENVGSVLKKSDISLLQLVVNRNERCQCLYRRIITDHSTQKLGSQVKRCALQPVHRQTDRATTESPLSGFQDFFPSNYHQGSAQYHTRAYVNTNRNNSFDSSYDNKPYIEQLLVFGFDPLGWKSGQRNNETKL